MSFCRYKLTFLLAEFIEKLIETLLTGKSMFPSFTVKGTVISG